MKAVGLVGLVVGMVVLASGAALMRAQGPLTVVQVAASRHILMLLSDGTVSAMGENRSGQLGRPPVIRRFMRAERVELPGKVRQVEASEDTSFALLEDGTVWAWGRGYEGQFGVAQGEVTRYRPGMVPGLTDVARISVDGNAAMAVLTDGTVRAWGDVHRVLTAGRESGPGAAMAGPIKIIGLEQVAAVSGGAGSGFALTTDGRVFGWGSNGHGALGLGTTSVEPQRPTELPTLRDVVSILRVATSAAAVTRDGRVWTWGHNQQSGLGNGQNGDTSDEGRPTPTPVAGIADAVEVKGGSYGRHIIVRRRNGTLIGWGNSDWGQLGAGISGDFQPKPTPIKLPNVEAYWLGGNFSFARTTDGALWFWGEEFGGRGLLGVPGNQRVPVKVAPEKYLPAAATP
jgi:alpha-tubulin suppressor-like RCC1 family protein